MSDTARYIAFASIAWSALLLTAQLIAARGHGRRDFSVRAGSKLQGLIYNFTAGMMPAHKETVRKHPIKFLIGVVMHMGAFAGFAKVGILLSAFSTEPIYPPVTLPFLGIAFLCGVYLLVRRATTPYLRIMSVFDDYFSILATLCFIAFTMLHEANLIGGSFFLYSSAGLFFYLPLGKLKHALFFFVARANYGARLGYRGVYPAS